MELGRRAEETTIDFLAMFFKMFQKTMEEEVRWLK